MVTVLFGDQVHERAGIGLSNLALVALDDEHLFGTTAGHLAQLLSNLHTAHKEPASVQPVGHPRIGNLRISSRIQFAIRGEELLNLRIFRHLRSNRLQQARSPAFSVRIENNPKGRLRESSIHRRLQVDRRLTEEKKQAVELLRCHIRRDKNVERIVETEARLTNHSHECRPFLAPLDGNSVILHGTDDRIDWNSFV